jgi:hypothetical protein
MMCAVDMSTDGMTIHIKCHDDRFRNSSNIKGITSWTWEAVVLVLLMKGIYDVRRWDGYRWHDIHTKCYDDQFRHLNNIKGITSTILQAVVLVLLTEGFMMYAVVMASGDMIYVPSSMTMG